MGQKTIGRKLSKTTQNISLKGPLAPMPPSQGGWSPWTPARKGLVKPEVKLHENNITHTQH